MIKVNELIPNAFSKEQADILRNKIMEELGKEDVVELDFEGIKRFTLCSSILVQVKYLQT